MASSRPAGGWRISWRYRLPNVAHRFGVRGAAMIHRTSVWLGASSGSPTSKKFLTAFWSLRTPLGVLLCTLYAGIVVDRVDKRRLIVLTQALQMAEATALGVLVLAKVIAVWQVMVLALGFGLVNAFDIPARQAFLVELVGKRDLVSAIDRKSTRLNSSH